MYSYNWCVAVWSGADGGTNASGEWKKPAISVQQPAALTSGQHEERNGKDTPDTRWHGGNSMRERFGTLSFSNLSETEIACNHHATCGSLCLLHVYADCKQQLLTLPLFFSVHVLLPLLKLMQLLITTVSWKLAIYAVNWKTIAKLI